LELNFFSGLDFCLRLQHTLSPWQIERCLCQETSSNSTQDISRHKKKVWRWRRENIRSIAKIPFGFFVPQL